MPHRISIDTEQRVTRAWFTGAITGDDIIAATEELIADPDFGEDMDQLWIMMEVTQLVITPEQMRAMVNHDTGLVEEGVMGRVKVAIVVTGEARAIAAQLYQHQMQPSGQDVRIFGREEAAEAWVQAGRGG